jgi:hypothetical protein
LVEVHLKQHSTELYDGTSWISAPPMATARRELGGAGTQTLGLGFGGIQQQGVATQKNGQAHKLQQPLQP